MPSGVWIRTKEHNRKTSEATKNALASPEIRKRISEGTKRGYTLEVRAITSAKRMGHPTSQETRDKISKALTDLSLIHI